MVEVTPFFQLQDEKLTYFRTIIETMFKVLDDTTINVIFSADVILFFGESATGARVKIALPKEIFEDYTIQNNYYLGFSIKHLAKIFERTIIKSTVLTVSHSVEANKLLIEFNDHGSSNFEVPIWNYLNRLEFILVNLDKEELYKTHITLKKTKHGLPVLFGDQKFVDFDKDIGFELYVNPNREVVRITTAMTDITYPKARTLITGIGLSILYQLSGPVSQSIYEYNVIRDLFKLDSLESTIILSLATDSNLRIKYIFLDNEDCFFTVFINAYTIDPEEDDEE